MPTQPPHPCRQCGRLLFDGSDCPDHPRPKKIDKRQSASARGYGYEWKTKVRDPYIKANPWCMDPYQLHVSTQVSAQIVDHIVPKRQGGTDDWNNLQGLCWKCHQTKTARDGSRVGGGGVESI
jgi:5-methylcytosine-specific restriction protein A